MLICTHIAKYVFIWNFSQRIFLGVQDSCFIGIRGACPPTMYTQKIQNLTPSNDLTLSHQKQALHCTERCVSPHSFAAATHTLRFPTLLPNSTPTPEWQRRACSQDKLHRSYPYNQAIIFYMIIIPSPSSLSALNSPFAIFEMKKSTLCLIKEMIQNTFSCDHNVICSQYLLLSSLVFPFLYFLKKKFFLRVEGLQSGYQIQWNLWATVTQALW